MPRVSTALTPSLKVAAKITSLTVSPLHYSSQEEELVIRLGVWFWSFLSLSHCLSAYRAVYLPAGLSASLQGCLSDCRAVCLPAGLSACRAVCLLAERAPSHWLPRALCCRLLLP